MSRFFKNIKGKVTIETMNNPEPVANKLMAVPEITCCVILLLIKCFFFFGTLWHIHIFIIFIFISQFNKKSYCPCFTEF